MMPSDKIFIISISISLAVHGAILLQPSNLKLFTSPSKEKEIEVSYLKTPLQVNNSPKLPPKNEPLPKSLVRINARKPPPPFVDRESLFAKNKQTLTQKLAIAKPAIAKPDVIFVKKKITLPPVDMEKANNPVYISYYQVIREKIKRSAYHNYSRSDEGEVYLSFVVATDGTLKDVRLVEEKSSSNTYLKENALKSIKDASPFPVFPSELEYQQLSFNVIISFEIE